MLLQLVHLCIFYYVLIHFKYLNISSFVLWNIWICFWNFPLRSFVFVKTWIIDPNVLFLFWGGQKARFVLVRLEPGSFYSKSSSSENICDSKLLSNIFNVFVFISGKLRCGVEFAKELNLFEDKYSVFSWVSFHCFLPMKKKNYILHILSHFLQFPSKHIAYLTQFGIFISLVVVIGLDFVINLNSNRFYSFFLSLLSWYYFSKIWSLIFPFLF